MNRLPALFITLLFVFSGCGAKEPTAVVVNRSFCCPVSVEQNGLRYEAELTATPEQCTAVFSLPAVMKGMTMSCKSGRVTVRYGSDQTEVPLPNPEQCFLFHLAQALAQTEATCTKKENAYVLHGVADGERYLLTVSMTTNKPQYFEMDSLDLTVKFQNAE